MNRTIAFLCCLWVVTSVAFCNCFLAKERDTILKCEGDCTTRYSPACSFNIALSLIGFDSGILVDEHQPTWCCPEEVECFLESWKGIHTPHSWMKNSVVWYSRELASLLGEKFKSYLEKFDYGNNDLTGEACWLSSTLQISPKEQVAFLQKIVDHSLPLSPASFEKAKKILFIQELPHGWKLYGKTGLGRHLEDLYQGWFVGFMERDQRTIVFASHVVDQQKESTFASVRARERALRQLTALIDNN